MAHDRKRAASGARRWVGNLLLAWTFVTGLSIAFGSAWYYRTKDLKIVIAYLGAPAIIGAALLLALLGVTLASRGKPRVPVEADGIRARKQKQQWFGR